ncbi:hypothetical protein V1515DRAFT_594432 [Lipomyces mesembrius]
MYIGIGSWFTNAVLLYVHVHSFLGPWGAFSRSLFRWFSGLLYIYIYITIERALKKTKTHAARGSALNHNMDHPITDKISASSRRYLYGQICRKSWFVVIK